MVIQKKGKGETMKRNKGISLIVLVITIIVMIILAGTIILSLNNGGIIQKSEDAVRDMNEAQLRVMVQVGWAEAYAQYGANKAKLQAGVDAIIAKNNIDISEYGILVTTDGVKVVRGWVQDGLTVKKGNKVIDIGDEIAYDETAAGTATVTTDVDWKILGANDDGELLIVSATNIGSKHTFGSTDYTECKNDLLTVKTQLDDICEPYMYGESATNARSITVEDVDKITGYDKTTFGKDTINEYGNEATFFYNTTAKPTYTSTNGIDGTLNTHSNGFVYYNGTNVAVVELADLKEKSNYGKIITTLKSNVYTYVASDLETVDTTSKAYTMLFGTKSDMVYWLASNYTRLINTQVKYGIQYISSGQLKYRDLFSSVKTANGEYSTGVRAVVSLKGDIQLTGSSETGWNY